MIPRSLGFRLSVILGVALALGLTVHFVQSMGHHEAALVRLKKEEASVLSAAIEASLTHAMLQGPEGRAAIREAIAEVAAKEEIERVRIFDADGLIEYSSDPTEMGRVVDKDAENCRQCHSGGKPATAERSRFFYTPEGAEESHLVLGVINPIHNDPEKRCTECHQERTVLGVLDVVVSLKNLDRDIKGHRTTLAIFGSIAVVGFIALVAALIHFLVHRPVAALVQGADRVGSLELAYRLPADRKDELGDMARAFNAMTARLERARARLSEFTEGLEKLVEERTEELRSTQDQMVRTEKMAAIGQMAAGVAHEINNPLTGVVTFAHLVKKRVPRDSQESEDLDTIIEEANRCSRIARGLLDFSRGGQLVKKPVHSGMMLDRVLSLVENQALFHNIEVVRQYRSDVQPVSADADRIQQVFLNLIVNAAEAMDGDGRLKLRTEREGDDFVRIDVEDTGPGIPEELRSRVFDPFFSTKETGEGTGLGLSVSYRIVDDHGGRIVLSAVKGGGTRFSVHLPVAREAEE